MNDFKFGVVVRLYQWLSAKGHPAFVSWSSPYLPLHPLQPCFHCFQFVHPFPTSYLSVCVLHMVHQFFHHFTPFRSVKQYFCYRKMTRLVLESRSVPQGCLLSVPRRLLQRLSFVEVYTRRKWRISVVIDKKQKYSPVSLLVVTRFIGCSFPLREICTWAIYYTWLTVGLNLL